MSIRELTDYDRENIIIELQVLTRRLEYAMNDGKPEYKEQFDDTLDSIKFMLSAYK